ncbi:hypothetical protein BDB00DRAFT_632684 [Zychaea mexicana]|uniref:uncharacterized protein n=1 Tax=Zychaea mexicana TaxID=64656 RepID=UPI0022FEB9DD|nr:uncharacterized protein BDB00DRAFT_632684 [Zychaea mexicana]KAI9489220.1 hypothetical protein BDB00DRAFT_632684 [Zychaea mexicana]
MGYPRWEDVSVKVLHLKSEEIYRFFVPRHIPIKDLFAKLEQIYKLKKNEYIVYYQDDEKSKVNLATEDDLHCALNRRQAKDGRGVDYGGKPIYFMRLFIKPISRKDKQKEEEEKRKNEQNKDEGEKRKTKLICYLSSAYSTV